MSKKIQVTKNTEDGHCEFVNTQYFDFDNDAQLVGALKNCGVSSDEFHIDDIGNIFATPKALTKAEEYDRSFR